MQKNSNVNVLNSIYRGAETGIQAITDLIPKVKDPGFRSDLETQEREYRTISAEAVTQMQALGSSPDPVSPVKKVGMKAAVSMNTMTDITTSHLAELMIKGSNMGIVNMTKVINDYSEPKDEIAGLGNRLIQLEQQNIDRLKAYL